MLNARAKLQSCYYQTTVSRAIELPLALCVWKRKVAISNSSNEVSSFYRLQAFDWHDRFRWPTLSFSLSLSLSVHTGENQCLAAARRSIVPLSIFWSSIALSHDGSRQRWITRNEMRSRNANVTLSIPARSDCIVRWSYYQILARRIA